MENLLFIKHCLILMMSKKKTFCKWVLNWNFIIKLFFIYPVYKNINNSYFSWLCNEAQTGFHNLFVKFNKEIFFCNGRRSFRAPVFCRYKRSNFCSLFMNTSSSKFVDILGNAFSDFTLSYIIFNYWVIIFYIL